MEQVRGLPQVTAAVEHVKDVGDLRKRFGQINPAGLPQRLLAVQRRTTSLSALALRCRTWSAIQPKRARTCGSVESLSSRCKAARTYLEQGRGRDGG